MSEIATNRKAARDYHILEKYEAGVELRGTEVKSIRLGKLNISDAFARVSTSAYYPHGNPTSPDNQDRRTNYTFGGRCISA